MIAFDRGIIAYTDRYLLARNVSFGYAETLRHRIGRFAEWCGSDPPIDSVRVELVNEWLTELAESGLGLWSLRGYRGAILTVWSAAFEAGDNHNPPLRVKLFRRPRMIVEAYSHAELVALLQHAATLRKIHADGNRACYFWQAAIHVGYCCGPRRGDLLAINRSQLADGAIAFVQRKTGFPHRVRLSAAAIEFCSRLRGSKLLPWPYQADYFSKSFKRLRKAAGIERGSFKWVRRSAGSYAERECPGAGARLLGHRDESVFRRFYNDESISSTLPPEPPPLRE